MNEIDKLIKSKLDTHESPYPSDMWDKVHAGITKQKPNSRWIVSWFWIGLLAILLVGGSYWLYNKYSKNSGSHSVATPISDHLDNATKNGSSTSTIDAEDVKVNETQDQNKSKYSDDTYDSINESPVISDEKIIAVNDNTRASNIKSNLESNVIATNAQGESEKGNEENKTNNANKVSISEASQSTLIIDNEISKESDNLNVTNIKTANSSSTVSVPGLQLVDAPDKYVKLKPIRTIGVSPFTELTSNDEIANLPLSERLTCAYRQDCPSFVTDRTGVYLDFYISHDYAFHNLGLNNSELESYRDQRAETETNTYSFSAGGRLTLMLPNGLGLKTGLNYSQVNQRFSYIDPESNQTRTVITIDTIDGIEMIDTNYVVIPGTREIASTNKYKSIDIPLLLSYEWDVRERMYMTVNGGVYLNLLFSESGNILAPGEQVIDLNQMGGDGLKVYKTNIGLSLFGSVGLHYRMNSYFDLIIEPNVKLLVKSATVDTYPVSHKWMTAGLITGVRYNF